MMIFKKAIPRRTILKGAGAALALPLLDGMVPAFAGPTDTAAKPAIRMGFMYVPNGIILNNWTPATEGANFRRSLRRSSPSLPFRDRFLVLSGLDQKHANMLPGEGGAFHSRASAAFLTGVHPKPTEGVDMRAGISVDQIAARELGKQTQLASLEMCLDPVEAAGVCEPQYTCAYMNTISWRTPTTPMPMEDHPRVVFERLFGDSDTTDRASRIARIQKNRSLLDFPGKQWSGTARGERPPRPTESSSVNIWTPFATWSGASRSPRNRPLASCRRWSGPQAAFRPLTRITPS